MSDQIEQTPAAASLIVIPAAGACWCAYGWEGTEFTRFPHPGCPEHDPDNTPATTPATDDREMEPCDVCRTEWDDCGSCDGSGEDDYAGDGCCRDCGGTGGCVPNHCCRCGGNEYNCVCCSSCGGDAGRCSCPIPVQTADGSVRVIAR